MEQIETIKYLIKIIFISIFTLKLNYKFVSYKQERNKLGELIIILCGDIVCTVVQYISDSTISIIFLDVFLAFLLSRIIKKNIGYTLLVTTVSLTINFILYLISIVISFIIFYIINYSEKIFIFMFILFLYIMFFRILCNIKRLKNGIIFFKNNENNEYFGLLILNISATILFAIVILSNIEITMKRSLFVYIIIFSIVVFITIQKSLQLYYKQKLQEREVLDIKEEIKSKDREIKELEKENLKLNKINHSLSHKIKSIEYELDQTAIKTDMKKENHLKNKVENLSKEMQNDIVPVELSKTNIAEIDSMLEYMQSECIKNKIDFQLQVSGNIHHMVNTYIQKENMEILLADLIKNAIIAINHTENINKSILVRLGIIEGFYSLYIYDSGIEFEIETLINLGNKPSTTHKNDGGTGMGFMNTFDTLRKYKASIVICEYGKPSEERFTKLIKIIFDKKNEYKISSYRNEEIREKDFEKRIELSEESTY